MGNSFYREGQADAGEKFHHSFTIFVADAHRDDGKRFVVRADEILTAFLELESVVRACCELS